MEQKTALPLLASLNNSDASALENLSHHLSDELNRRTYALFRQQPEIEQMKQQLHLLKKAVHSAEEWQKRGRIKRAFHQWKAPEGILENLLVDSKTPVAIEKKPSLSPKTEIKNLKKQVRDLQKTVKSATQWQKRSWIKRAFHKWKPPGQS